MTPGEGGAGADACCGASHVEVTGQRRTCVRYSDRVVLEPVGFLE